MKLFIGEYERNIDKKNRIQIPAQLRSVVAAAPEDVRFYVTLGEFPQTLALYPEQVFEDLANRIETEYIPGERSRKFELQFYSLASHVALDTQGRLVLPERLRRKAKLGDEVLLAGQKHRVDIWNRAAYEATLGIDWDGDDWPDWQPFVRMRPGGTGGEAKGGSEN
jgi:MraZ protein